MKVLIFLSILAFSLSLTVGEELNWATAKPAWQHPNYRAVFEAFYPEETQQLSLPTSRIYGGWEAQRHQFPYMVADYFYTPEGWYFCGGSLISQYFVLTAAHCSEPAETFQFWFGAHYLDQFIGTEQIVNVPGANKIVHPSWNPTTLQNDISLVRLNNPVTLNNYVKLVRLPCYSQASATFADQVATISGWGRTPAGQMSNVLLYTQNPILHYTDCAARVAITSDMICLSGANGRGTCSGDSGSPLVIGTVQVGVHSFGVNGCGSDFPKGASRVTSYLSWIGHYVAMC